MELTVTHTHDQNLQQDGQETLSCFLCLRLCCSDSTVQDQSQEKLALCEFKPLPVYGSQLVLVWWDLKIVSICDYHILMSESNISLLIKSEQLTVWFTVDHFCYQFHIVPVLLHTLKCLFYSRTQFYFGNLQLQIKRFCFYTWNHFRIRFWLVIMCAVYPVGWFWARIGRIKELSEGAEGFSNSGMVLINGPERRSKTGSETQNCCCYGGENSAHVTFDLSHQWLQVDLRLHITPPPTHTPCQSCWQQLFPNRGES